MYKRKLIKGGLDPVTIATTGALATVGAATVGAAGTLLASKLRKKKRSTPKVVDKPEVVEEYIPGDSDPFNNRDSTGSNDSWTSAAEDFEDFDDDDEGTQSPPVTAPSPPTSPPTSQPIISDDAIINYLDLLITTYHNKNKRLLSSVTIDVPFIYQILHHILEIIDTSHDIDKLLTDIGDSNNGIIEYVLKQLEQRVEGLGYVYKKIANQLIKYCKSNYLENENWDNNNNELRLTTLKDTIKTLLGGELNIKLTSMLSAVINENMEKYLQLMEFEQEEQEQITLIVNKYLTDKAGFLSILSELKAKNTASAGGYKIKSKKANKSIKRKNKSFKNKSFKRKNKSIKRKKKSIKRKRNLSKRKKSIN